MADREGVPILRKAEWAILKRGRKERYLDFSAGI